MENAIYQHLHHRRIIRLSYDLLSPFDSQLAPLLDQLAAERRDLFPQGWFSGPAGAAALARRLHRSARDGKANT